MTTASKRLSAICYLAVAAGLATGCSAPKMSDFKPSKIFSMKSSWPWRDSDEPTEGIPMRLVGTWTDTIMTRAGEKAQRGFGGRLVFYGRDDKEPILVDGQLVVYAFDETGRDPTDNKPTRRYVFPADQMPLHMSKSELGASYSFWLPWDEAGGPRTEVSLICRFEPKGGAIIASEQTRHILPGALVPSAVAASRQPPRLPEGVPSTPALPTLESMMSARRAEGGAQLASYEATTGAAAGPHEASVSATSIVPEKKMGITSIKLPANFQLPAAASPAASAGAASSVATLPQQQTIQRQASPMATPVVANPTGATPAARHSGSIWQPAPATQTSGAFGSPQLVRPLVTPQFMSLQPTPMSTGAPAVNYPQQAVLPQTTTVQPASPQPLVR